MAELRPAPGADARLSCGGRGRQRLHHAQGVPAAIGVHRVLQQGVRQVRGDRHGRRRAPGPRGVPEGLRHSGRGADRRGGELRVCADGRERRRQRAFRRVLHVDRAAAVRGREERGAAGRIRGEGRAGGAAQGQEGGRLAGQRLVAGGPQPGRQEKDRGVTGWARRRAEVAGGQWPWRVPRTL